MAYDLSKVAKSLDITSWKQKGPALLEAIENEIRPLAKSKLLIRLPAIIEMKQHQYDDLMRVSKMPNMYHSDDRMLITKYNVMEVRVKNRHRPTFTEALDLSKKELKDFDKTIEGEDPDED